MEYALKTDLGGRAVNEDSCYIPVEGCSPIVMVADGLGGHSAGEMASALAVETFVRHVSRHAEAADDEALRGAVLHANDVIYGYASAHDGCHGMGTTVVAALLSERGYTAVNVGDSRLYYFDGTHITQVTRDHSFVAEMLELGRISPERAEKHPMKNMITRAVGVDAGVEPDLYAGEWKKGDVLLLCSDGLYGVVSEADMERILVSGSLQECADALVALALSRGTSDNVTVVLARNEVEA